MGPRLNIDAARRVLDAAVATRAFPAAVIEAGDRTRPLWQEAFGRLTFDPAAPLAALDTIFDLASLTKVIATAPLAMQQVERGVLDLDDRVARHVPAWQGADRAHVTLRDLLSHAGGLRGGWVKLFLDHRDRGAFTEAICRLPLEYAPRSRAVYSDLGFILLGFVLADEQPLGERLAAMLTRMGVVQDLQFNPPDMWRRRIAPTEFDPWRGRLLVGDVHDENAWALGGAAGHAGLFGTAPAVGDYARHLLQILDDRAGFVRRATLEMFIRRRDGVPGSSRALGWDTMLPTSSCGHHLSAAAFGHTGFTGTSLWIDPVRGVYAVLLTNRVHPTRENPAIQQVRVAVHDALFGPG